ncbi:MAG: glycosyltransferase [Anaerolineales bacterium]|nr:glycosyltransferase [Anaerolineales bacterium]
MGGRIPVVLFAYNRPNHLQRTLECLRLDAVPELCVFSDGPRTPEAAPAVSSVREILRSVDWCEVRLVERPRNLGLGISILTGVSEVLAQHAAAIIFEDDLICVPGTYQFLAAALNHYRSEPKVMSVTGWNHPRVTPPAIGGPAYFDGRAECLVWGTWQRAWQGMEMDALALIRQCRQQGIDPARYGADLPAMAEEERQRNIWAVRWLYLHILRGGLCLRPARSLVEHIGFGREATNAKDGTWWSNPPLQPCPPLPERWPEAVEHPGCAALWQKATRQSAQRRLYVVQKLKNSLRALRH